MNLTQAYAPTQLEDVIGQPDVVKRLQAFMIEPFPCWMALVGSTGTGKTTCATIVGDAIADPWFGVHRISGAFLNLDAVKELFGNDSRFRYTTAPNHFHVVRIEELELVPDKATVALKDAWDICRERNWRVIIIATSNNLGRLEDALRHRFGDPYQFLDGPEFAIAFNEWMKTIWRLEGSGPMPDGWQMWGFDDTTGKFSARLALDRMESSLQTAKVLA
jgi:AAA+ superfamily predicted ATPase